MAARFWVLLAVLAIAPPSFAGPGEPGEMTCRPAPELDGVFERSEGWIGADAAYSVRLEDDSNLWLFGDTLLGKSAAGQRQIRGMARNTIAIQRGKVPTLANVAFYTGSGPGGTFFHRPEMKNWFWPLDGTCTARGLFVVLSEIEATDHTSVFGFRQVGTWLASVPNWRDEPSRWRIAYSRIPHVRFGNDGLLTFGAAVLQWGGNIYLYGVREKGPTGKSQKSMVVASVRSDDPSDFAAWRFHAADGWVTEPEKCVSIRDEISSEFTVSYNRSRDALLLVYSKDLSPEVRVAESWDPVGPWRQNWTVYRCPEPGRDPKLFSYAAKGHWWMSAMNSLLLTYVTNSFDVARLKDASIYRPRFLWLDVGHPWSRPQPRSGSTQK